MQYLWINFRQQIFNSYDCTFIILLQDLFFLRTVIFLLFAKSLNSLTAWTINNTSNKHFNLESCRSASSCFSKYSYKDLTLTLDILCIRAPQPWSSKIQNLIFKCLVLHKHSVLTRHYVPRLHYFSKWSTGIKSTDRNIPLCAMKIRTHQISVPVIWQINWQLNLLVSNFYTRRRVYFDLAYRKLLSTLLYQQLLLGSCGRCNDCLCDLDIIDHCSSYLWPMHLHGTRSSRHVKLIRCKINLYVRSHQISLH